MKVFLLNIYRSIKYGFQNFGRNVFLSIATTSILVLTLFGLGFFIIINQISTEALRSIESKVDFNIYVAENVPQDTLSAFTTYVENLEEVQTVQVISKEEATQLFQERFQDNPNLLTAFQLLDSNPLPVTIRVQAVSSQDYTQIWDQVQQYPQFAEVVESSDFDEDRSTARETIDRLNSIVSTVRSIGISVIIVLAIIAVLVTYNTVRLTMYSYRNEIEIMRLVGASDNQIKGPFIVEGILFGVFGTFVAFLILFIVVFGISEPVKNFIDGSQSISEYMLNHALFIIIAKLVVGISLGVGSSLIAINRYLKV